MKRLMELLHGNPCRRFGIPPDTGFTVFDLNSGLSDRPGRLPVCWQGDSLYGVERRGALPADING